MPYIKDHTRPKFTMFASELADLIEVDGELNYVVTALVHNLLMKRGVNYQNAQNLDGCLSQIRTEFCRTVIGPYEDIKRKENGFVSNLDKMLAEGKVPTPGTY